MPTEDVSASTAHTVTMTLQKAALELQAARAERDDWKARCEQLTSDRHMWITRCEAAEKETEKLRGAGEALLEDALAMAEQIARLRESLVWAMDHLHVYADANGEYEAARAILEETTP